MLRRNAGRNRRASSLLAQSPALFSGLQGWFDAMVGVSPGATFTWADRSGRGNNATQATAINQPAYAPSPQWRGKPVLSFGPSIWLLANGLGPMIDGDHLPLSVVCALRHDTALVTCGYASWDAAAGSQNFFRCLVDPTIGAMGAVEHDGTVPGADVNVQTADGTDSTPHVIVTSYTGTDVSIYIDGSATSVAGAAMNPPAATSTTSFTIGNLLRGFFGTQGLVGEIAELAIYNRALTAGEQKQIQSYLKNKWGTA